MSREFNESHYTAAESSFVDESRYLNFDHPSLQTLEREGLATVRHLRLTAISDDTFKALPDAVSIYGEHVPLLTRRVPPYHITLITCREPHSHRGAIMYSGVRDTAEMNAPFAAEFFRKADFDFVAVFDSSGNYRTIGMHNIRDPKVKRAAELAAATEEVLNTYKPQKLVMIGHSLGTTDALTAVPIVKHLPTVQSGATQIESQALLSPLGQRERTWSQLLLHDIPRIKSLQGEVREVLSMEGTLQTLPPPLQKKIAAIQDQLAHTQSVVTKSRLNLQLYRLLFHEVSKLLKGADSSREVRFPPDLVYMLLAHAMHTGNHVLTDHLPEWIREQNDTPTAFVFGEADPYTEGAKEALLKGNMYPNAATILVAEVANGSHNGFRVHPRYQNILFDILKKLQEYGQQEREAQEREAGDTSKSSIYFHRY